MTAMDLHRIMTGSLGDGNLIGMLIGETPHLFEHLDELPSNRDEPCEDGEAKQERGEWPERPWPVAAGELGEVREAVSDRLPYHHCPPVRGISDSARGARRPSAIPSSARR